MGAPLIKVLERRGMRTRCAMNASGVGRIHGRWRPLCDGDGPAYDDATRCSALLCPLALPTSSRPRRGRPSLAGLGRASTSRPPPPSPSPSPRVRVVYA